MVKVSLDVSKNPLKNPSHSKILIYLSKKPNNAVGLIGLNIGRTQSVLSRQLQKLENEKFVYEIDLNTKGKGKKKFYDINYRLLFEYFLLFSINNKNYDEYNVNYEVEKNIYCENFIKSALSFHYEKGEILTIDEIFSKLLKILLQFSIDSEQINQYILKGMNRNFYSSFSKLSSQLIVQNNDKELETFLDYIKTIKTFHLSFNQFDLIEKLFFDIGYTINKKNSNLNLDKFLN